MLKKFLPAEYVKTVFEITPEKLIDKGIKGIIVDLDNTLVEWDRPEATKEVFAWMESMRNAGIFVTIVSNNNKDRVRVFARPLGIPFIHDAHKPRRKSFKRVLKRTKFKKEEIVVIGDQLLTDIFGGNRAGLHTILVAPIASSDALITRFNRMTERRIMASLRRRGLITWEE